MKLIVVLLYIPYLFLLVWFVNGLANLGFVLQALDCSNITVRSICGLGGDLSELLFIA